MQVIRSPAAASREPGLLFSFDRPAKQYSRRKRTALMQLSEQQEEILYALAGCADVNFLFSNVCKEVGGGPSDFGGEWADWRRWAVEGQVK